VIANNSNQTDMGTLPTSSSQPPVPLATIAASPSSPTEVQRTPVPNFTDKIRAVIYPNQRSWRSPGTSTSRDTNVEDGQSVAPGEHPTPTPTPTNLSQPADSFVTGQARRPMDGVTSPKESGLAQLSRMLQ